MRKYPKRLTLSRETILSLNPAELRQAAGQATTPLCIPPTHVYTCPSFKLCPTQLAQVSCVQFCTPSQVGQCD
jgi:hypothetical protein